MFLVKYDQTGSKVSNFGDNGIVIHNNAAGGNDSDMGKSICLNSNNDIYVVGSSENVSNSYDLIIWKYKKTGILDSAFGLNGIVKYDSSQNDYGESIIIGSDSSLLVAGKQYNSVSGNFDAVMWEYTQAGESVLAFGNNGNGSIVYDSTSGFYGNDYGDAVIQDDQGNFYMLGEQGSPSTFDLFISKYNNSGILDINFGTNGVIIENNLSGLSAMDDCGESLILNNNNEIIATGWSQADSGTDMIILKTDLSGQHVSSFGTGGVVVHNNAAGGNGSDYGKDVIVDDGNNIYVCGSSKSATDTRMVVWKYSDSGEFVSPGN